MSWQSVATFLVIAAAVAYVVYKVFFASRSSGSKRGPDVPLSRLRKDKNRRSRRDPGD